MSTSKLVLSLAIVLGSATLAMAAPKHTVRQPAGEGAYASESANGTSSPSVTAAERREQAGDPRCRGGNCDPDWNNDNDE
jgi:hypothetical protein